MIRSSSSVAMLAMGFMAVLVHALEGDNILRKVKDMTHAVRMDELPVNGDHEFVHHEELLEALSRGEKSFTSYDIHHMDMRNDEEDAVFMNLGGMLGDSERAYDTKVDVSLHEDSHYLVLDHDISAEVQEISDGSMLCHADIKSGKLEAGDYIVGTGSGNYAKSEKVLKWIANTEHVGPRVKDDEGT